MKLDLRPGRVAPATLGAAALMAVLLAAGCSTVDSPARRWDRDRPIVPLKAPSDSAFAANRGEPELRSVVILLPDEDGSVGAIDVETSAGNATLTRAREAIALDDPSSPYIATSEEIGATYRPALDAEPESARSYTVYFDSDDVRPMPSAEWEATLDALAARAVPEVRVSAHCDRYGSDEYNRRLSERRALAIHDALVAAGLDAALIELAWHGEERPAVPTADGVREARNRRAEIRVR